MIWKGAEKTCPDLAKSGSEIKKREKRKRKHINHYFCGIYAIPMCIYDQTLKQFPIIKNVTQKRKC